MDKNNKRKAKKYHLLIIFTITVISTMWIYGMVKIYFPTPLDVGFGQYLDVGTGVVIGFLLIIGFIIGLLFKKKKNT